MVQDEQKKCAVQEQQVAPSGGKIAKL